MEKLGIEHVDEDKRHGSPFNTFTLWFGANLTIADFALLPVLLVFYPLPFNTVVLAIVVGNVLGGLLLGLMAAMGPTFGYPQMMISRAAMGKTGNVPFAAANWVSTVGWFTINIILGGYALQLILNIPFVAAAAVLVIFDVLLATYGHDIIHSFEKAMSVVLAVLFGVMTLVAYTKMGGNFATYQSSATFSLYSWVVLVAVIFSYLMSWSPYASDYSRYLPKNTSKFKVVAFTMAGGAIASAWTELVGFFVYVAANNSKLNAIAMLQSASGGLAAATLLAIVLGAVAADALNLYTNSLSALVLLRKAGRIKTVLVAGVVGYIFALAASSNFGSFYQNFLLTLDYWITPWIGVMAAMFFVKKVSSGVENAPSFLKAGLGSYVLGLLISVPFMNLSSYGIAYVGPVANAIGGADVSYFVGALAAFVVYAAISWRDKL